MYINSECLVKPYLDGGSQERNMRAGTENVYGIVGLGKALELSIENMEANKEHALGLKKYMMQQLKQEVDGIGFNGAVTEEDSNYKVLSVSLPPHQKAELTLFNLDMAGIAASGGSACSSGSEKGSHVLENIQADVNRKAVRFSFSKFNTTEEVDYVVEVLKKMYEKKAVTQAV